MYTQKEYKSRCRKKWHVRRC